MFSAVVGIPSDPFMVSTIMYVGDTNEIPFYIKIYCETL